MRRENPSKRHPCCKYPPSRRIVGRPPPPGARLVCIASRSPAVTTVDRPALRLSLRRRRSHLPPMRRRKRNRLRLRRRDRWSHRSARGSDRHPRAQSHHKRWRLPQPQGERREADRNVSNGRRTPSCLPFSRCHFVRRAAHAVTFVPPPWVGSLSSSTKVEG
jgi:hypothetical protein